MIRLTISELDSEAIAEAVDDPSIEEHIKRKLMTIRMHELNVPSGNIAKILNVSDDTITNYLKLYQEQGLKGILENRYYQPTSQVEPFLDQIRRSLDEDPVSTAKEGAQRIKELTEIQLSDSQACRIMKKLGLKYRKSAGIPGKADPQLQLDFLTDELLPRLEEAQKGERRVFFVDAAHFVHGSFLGMIWSFQRLFIPTSSGRKRYNVLGAVETRNHDLVTIRTTENINAETICELTKVIHEKYRNESITLVMDNASYQHNKKVAAFAQGVGIELLFLPTYSPNLNLIERVWKLVKSRCMRNKYFDTFKKFREAIDDFVDSLNGPNKDLLESLVTEKFQTFQIPKT